MSDGQKIIFEHNGNNSLNFFINFIKKNGKIKRINKDYLFIFSDGIKLIQPDFGVLSENLDVYYNNLNLKGKIVLDVGGYYGETALLFYKKAKVAKVFIYEPIKNNQKYILKNIIINNCENNLFLYPLGVSNIDGIIKIKSKDKPGSASFGMNGGKYIEEIKVISWKKVLSNAIKNKVFLAKIDCEGCEKKPNKRR